jgi:hypothetical protein
MPTAHATTTTITNATARDTPRILIVIIVIVVVVVVVVVVIDVSVIRAVHNSATVAALSSLAACCAMVSVIGNYALGASLGQGQYGKVWQGRHTGTLEVSAHVDRQCGCECDRE